MLAGISGISREFMDLIKGIGESRSKSEEDRIVTKEVATLKQRFTERDISPEKMKEYLIRMMYVEMLGTEASFGYIHAVNLTQKPNLALKRVGYLAVSLCLHPEHELVFLLINTIRRDLASDSYLDKCVALNAVCRLITADTIPAVMPPVLKLLDHPEAVVRKRAVMAIHSFYNRDPTAIESCKEDLRRMLCDKDPSVMSAAVCLLQDLALENPSSLKNLVPSFVSILKQITEHRLPRDFDYHRMPAPWIQMNLLRVLALLGHANQDASEGMYEVLLEVMRRADTGTNIGFAIIYETVKTVTSIYPNTVLLESAADSITRFISSENHNLKYLGITGLAAIVQVNPKYAVDHQMIVIECLEDPDDTLKVKTLDLLYKMTNPHNVVVIIDKLLDFLRTTTNDELRADFVGKITQLAERYAPDDRWYIRTLNVVFEQGAEFVRPEVAHNLMRMIAEGTSDDADADDELRAFAVDTYVRILQRGETIPDILMQVVAWVVGEYAHMCSLVNVDEAIALLVDATERNFTEKLTKNWILSALMKLVAQSGRMDAMVEEVFDRYASSRLLSLQQRCAEFKCLIDISQQDPTILASVLPVDASCEDLDVDPDMDFLNAFVERALANGARPYQPPASLDDEIALAKETLRFEAYEQPADPRLSTPSSFNELRVRQDSVDVTPTAAASPAKEENLGLNTSGVARRWGPAGYSGSLSTAGAAGAAGGASASPEKQDHAPQDSTPQVASSQDHSPQPDFSAPSEEPARPEPPRKTEEQLQKERAAAALFSGIGGITGGSPSPREEKRSKKKSSRHLRDTDRKPSNILDVGSDSGRAVTPPKTTPAPAQQATATPPAATSSIDMLLDLGPLPPTAQTPTAQSTGPPPSAGSLDDLLGGGFGGSSSDLLSGIPPPVPVGRSDWARAPLPQAIQSMIGSFPRSADTNVELAGDPTLHISYFKVYKPNELTVVLFFFNQASTSISDVTAACSVPMNLAVSYDGQPGVEYGPNGIRIGAMQPGVTMVGVMHVTSSEPVRAVSTGALTLGGSASYSVEGRAGVLPFQLCLQARDIVRPALKSTQEFGQLWSSLPCERKVAVQGSTVTTPQMLMMRFKACNLHPVEVIGMEGISSGRTCGGKAENTILCHGRVSGNGAVEVTVRARDRELSALVCQALNEQLA